MTETDFIAKSRHPIPHDYGMGGLWWPPLVSVPDLLIAATAERHGLTVLHYDADYQRVAALTGQPVQWIVPPGTAD